MIELEPCVVCIGEVMKGKRRRATYTLDRIRLPWHVFPSPVCLEHQR